VIAGLLTACSDSDDEDATPTVSAGGTTTVTTTTTSSASTTSVTSSTSTTTTAAEGPEAPSDVTLSGALPDLNTPVPPGEGEMGRLTIAWTDNSDNEDGFRVYQECDGTQSVLLEVEADETSYGPFQTCRPGRVGVAAYNTDGESEIVWATPAASTEPAAPSDVALDGALPDLNTPVPPGQGELGRLTISWTDNSDDEEGFRVYQECDGAQSVLLEVTADETSYGPFQTCRPGRVGVAAYNAQGESEIVWVP
jgi:hypothetical protein